MAEQTNPIIDALCERLGIPFRYLIPLLVRQAYVDGAVSIIRCTVWAAVIFVTVKYCKYFYFDSDKNGVTNYRKAYKSANESAVIVGTVCLCFASVACLGAIIFDAKSALSAFINPEGYVIWYVIKSLMQEVQA